MDEPTLTISEVAEQAGVNASAIRYYERVGVLPKPDRFGGERRYTSETVGKLHVVELTKGAGCSCGSTNRRPTSARSCRR
jgi:DNA-binding transcriptional MerR regulator